MERGSIQSYDSVRQQEQAYEKEVRQTYQQNPQLFLTHSSDNLHLQVVKLFKAGSSYEGILTTSPFQKYDIIAEVRGSVIGSDKLRKLVDSRVVERDQLPLLLHLNPMEKWLISPKNIAKYLFNNPQQRQSQGESNQGNCYIDRHYDCKLLVTASRDIGAGEELELEQKNYGSFVYNLV